MSHPTRQCVSIGVSRVAWPPSVTHRAPGSPDDSARFVEPVAPAKSRASALGRIAASPSPGGTPAAPAERAERRIRNPGRGLGSRQTRGSNGRLCYHFAPSRPSAAGCRGLLRCARTCSVASDRSGQARPCPGPWHPPSPAITRTARRADRGLGDQTCRSRVGDGRRWTPVGSDPICQAPLPKKVPEKPL